MLKRLVVVVVVAEHVVAALRGVERPAALAARPGATTAATG
jgi:hypothetical protein